MFFYYKSSEKISIINFNKYFEEKQKLFFIQKNKII